jgi:hypothetical protein
MKGRGRRQVNKSLKTSVQGDFLDGFVGDEYAATPLSQGAESSFLKAEGLRWREAMNHQAKADILSGWGHYCTPLVAD